MSLQNKAGYGIEEEPLEPTSLFEQQSSEGDASLNTVVFSEGEDANLTSGSTLSALFGKIKYFINNIASYFGNIITASASVDNSSGTPSVTVTKTVTQDNKIDINFEFTNLKGADGKDGKDGVTPSITASASVDNNTGTPSVNVTKSGTDANPVFNFAFSNLKGVKGTDGQNGVGISSITKTSTNGLVDTYTIMYTDGSTSNFTVTNGVDGQNGTNGVGIASIVKTGTSGLVDTYTITFTDNTTSTFTVTNGADGKDGKDGVTPSITASASVDSNTSGTPSVNVTKTGTDAAPNFDFAFSNLKGNDGQNGTNGVGVPTGGTAGQVLSKVDGTDYNTQWTTPTGGGPTVTRRYRVYGSGSTNRTIAISPNIYINPADYDSTKDYIQIFFDAFTFDDDVTAYKINNEIHDIACFRVGQSQNPYYENAFFVKVRNSSNVLVNVLAQVHISYSVNSGGYSSISARVTYYDMSGNLITSSNGAQLGEGTSLDVRIFKF